MHLTRASTIALALCCPALATAQALSPVLEKHQGNEPALSTESTVLPGEAMYAEFDYPLQTIFRLPRGVRYNRKISLSPGDLLAAFQDRSGKVLFCSDRERSSAWGGGTVCLVDSDDDGRIDRFKVVGTSALAARMKKKPVGEPIPIEPERTPLSAEDAKDYVGDFYRKEIVYQGVGGGVLRVQYREFVNDMARPAFSQELTFDVAPDGPTVVVVKGARVRVLEAGNEGVRYEVEAAFN